MNCVAPSGSAWSGDAGDPSIFRSLFAAYPDALLLVDAAGLVVLANPQASVVLGYTTDELVGLPVDALVPDMSRPRHATYREAYAVNPRPRPMGTQTELVARRRDGSEVTVEIALSPLLGLGSSLVVAAIRDIAAYPRVRQALQRARHSEFLAKVGWAAVESSDPHTVLDLVPAVAAEAIPADSAIVYLLDADRLSFRVESGLGMLPSETVGSRVPNRPASSPGFVVVDAQPVTVFDYRQEQRFRLDRPGVESELNSEISVPLLDGGGVIGALTVRSRQPMRPGHDEIRFLESLANLLVTRLQRARSDEALIHAQRLESIGQLTGGIAHDFNNLLTIMQGNLQVLEELPIIAEHERASELIGAAIRAARRGADLTAKLLTFSRRQVLRPVAVDVGELLASLADMLRRTLDHSIEVLVQVPPGCIAVWADSVQLESALLNLSINARDAMPEGGTLCFRAEPCDTPPPELFDRPVRHAASAQRFVAISISDTGSGMADEVKARAFEPFFTTKELGRGTGLGLSTVYGFANQSKGTISLQSGVGAGTTITLYLPAVSELTSPLNAVAQSHGFPKNLRVLLVEDDDDVRSIVGRFLDALECRVTSCSSAELALDKLTPDASFDLLLSDVALDHNLRGTQLAAEAQRRFPGLAVLLMSGFPAELLNAEAEFPVTWEFLRKPYKRQDLAQAIARALRRS